MAVQHAAYGDHKQVIIMLTINKQKCGFYYCRFSNTGQLTFTLLWSCYALMCWRMLCGGTKQLSVCVGWRSVAALAGLHESLMSA